MIELGDSSVPCSSENAERVVAAIKKELGAVEIPTDNPRFQELLDKQTYGTLSFSERDELNDLVRRATAQASPEIP